MKPLFSSLVTVFLLSIPWNTNASDNVETAPNEASLTMLSILTGNIIETEEDGERYIWKYDLPPFVSGDLLNVRIIRNSDSIIYLRDRNKYVLKTQNDSIFLQSIQNRQTHVFFKPEIPVMFPNMQDSIVSPIAGIAEYGDSKNHKILGGFYKTESKGYGVLVNDGDTIKNVHCLFSEALFKYQNDSLCSQDKGINYEFKRVQISWSSPLYPFPILTSESLLRIMPTDTTIISCRSILYPPELQFCDKAEIAKVYSHQLNNIDNGPFDVMADNDSGNTVVIKNIQTSADGITIDAISSGDHDVNAEFIISNISGRVLYHTTAVVPSQTSKEIFLPASKQFIGLLLMKVTCGNSSESYKIIQ